MFKEKIAKDFVYNKEQGKIITSTKNGHVAYPGDECFGSWAWCVTDWKEVEETIRKKSKATTEEETDINDDEAIGEEAIV